MVNRSTSEPTEIISVASGKGGTGKTSVLASLGYALQTSGLRVLFIDTDSATDGLSLFLLGPRGWETISDLVRSGTFSGYLRARERTDASSPFPTAFKVNRGRKDDHGQIYEVLISGRGLYGDVSDEINQSVSPQLTRESFRHAIQHLFDHLRGERQWDYVLVDTRGGFTFNTTDVCALSDSFLLVTEPQFTSFYQDKNLIFRIAAASAEVGRKPALRGIIVNKATESSRDDDRIWPKAHSLNLDSIEASFRNVLVDEFSIRYSDTYPVPLDLDAMQAYKSQRIPYVAYPASLFSYATLVAFSGLMKTVTVQWPEQVTTRWNELVDRISTAIKVENERVMQYARQEEDLQKEMEKLRQDDDLLRSKLKVFEESSAQKVEYDKALSRQRTAADRTRTILIGAIVGIIFLSLGLIGIVVIRGLEATIQRLETTVEQQRALNLDLERQLTLVRDQLKRAEDQIIRLQETQRAPSK
jgi:MinD-like ATPase involved in chromosome partitioning or flagellar assembly